MKIKGKEARIGSVEKNIKIQRNKKHVGSPGLVVMRGDS